MKRAFIEEIKQELRNKKKHNKLSIEKIAAKHDLFNKNIIKTAPKYKVRDIVLYEALKYVVEHAGCFNEFHNSFTYKIRNLSGKGFITANENELKLIKAAAPIEIQIRIVKVKTLAKIKLLNLLNAA